MEINEAPATPAEQPKSLSLLASERLGNKFYGEVQEQQPVEEEAPQEIVEEVEQEAEQIEEEVREEEGYIDSIDALAEFLKETQGADLDSEWFDSLKVKGKVNGEDRTYTLSELKASVQMVDAAESILESAKEKVKTQHQELAQKNEQITEQFVVASTLVEQLEASMIGDAQKIDWEALQKDDPGTFAAKKLEFQERQQEIQNIKMGAAQQYQQWVDQQQGVMKQAQEEQLQAEQEALLTKLPEWQDDKVASREKGEIAQFLHTSGFSNEELSSLADHRLLLLARKAWLYDQKDVPAAAAKEKKIARIPKTLTPGPTKSAAQVNQADLDSKRARLKQSGNIRDAFALLKAKKNAR
jgi:hypothetical protein